LFTDREEEFLFCILLSTTAIGEDIFEMIQSFFKQDGLNQNQCSSVHFHGAPAMFRAQQGFIARAKQVNQQTQTFHCLLHRENLAATPESDVVIKK
jgi:hypothetical protein